MAASRAPRVTLGVATYDRDTYLAQAIASGLAQSYDDFELLVVDDGSTNPAIAAVLAGFADDPRVRVVRHEANRGIAAAYDTIWQQGRGELIAMIGDDDVCLPDRLARQVAIFDRHSDTGVVHGDALVIDAEGQVTGRWDSKDFTPAALVHAFFRSHNHLVDPTRMVHRRVYEAVGGYDGSYKIAQDLHFWLRAAREHRFRHTPGGPLIGFRRHGANTSDESARELEIADVERALEMALGLYPLRALVPELDWAVLDPAEAERQALGRLAGALEQRLLPLPGLASRVRARAEAIAAPPRPPAPRNGRRLLMTAFGWNDAGGGTTVPRLAAKELARRGWDVTVFHAAVELARDRGPYHVAEWDEDGVQLIGVHNRRHGLWDLDNPLRELDDPPITAAYTSVLERVQPDAVHFHNLHNLGAALIDATAARGIPSYFSTHNYWLVCPRAYLRTGTASLCAGPGDGARCATCVERSGAEDEYRRRLGEIRARVARGVTACLAVSDAVRQTLLGAGYPADAVDVVRQGMPHDLEIWERLGRERTPGRAAGDALTVAFVGSAYPLKGPQLLVEAAQQTQAAVRVQIHGEVPDAYLGELLARDRRGVVELCGAFHPSEIERVLAGVDVAALPSMWWDCAPLVAAECLAARVPLLVPRLGGLAEAVRDGVDGLVFDALDAGDLARALDRVAGEPGLLERLQDGIEPPRSFAAYVDDLEAYYAGERPGRVEAATATDVVVRRPDATRLGDPPLPHAAHVEVRTQWPPDPRPAAAGRLVIVQPAEHADAPAPAAMLAALRPHLDELWVPSEPARAAAIDAGLDPERVVVLPSGDDATTAARIGALAARAPRATDPACAVPRELEEDVALRVLATPAWRGEDRLPELLAQWCAATTPATSACLYLLADSAVDGAPEALEARVLAAAEAGGAELERAGDINVLMEPLSADRDAALHAAVHVYVPLHPACAGHERIARATGNDLVALDGEGLARRLAGVAARVPA